MELSDDIIRGLAVASNSKQFSDNDYALLLGLSFDIALKQKAENELEGAFGSMDAIVLKQAYAGLVGFILEAGKNNAPALLVRGALDDNRVPEDRAESFVTQYEVRKGELNAMLRTTGFNFPNLVDAEWRLDFHMKSNSLEKVNRPSYYVRLKTETTRTGDETKDDKLQEFVEFNCSVEEMLDLTNKLQDAVKQIDRITGEK